MEPTDLRTFKIEKILKSYKDQGGSERVYEWCQRLLIIINSSKANNKERRKMLRYLHHLIHYIQVKEKPPCHYFYSKIEVL